MPLNLLVLGGTSWLGGAVARVAHERGHQVTCLARGESGQVPAGPRWVRADRWREDAYAEVADQDWDAVIDVSRQPEQVRSALAALADRTRQWVYVSSISVYADLSVPGEDESAPTHEPWTGTGEAGAEDYGPAKVACERACLGTLPPERVLVARAGLIVGYGDRSDRFGYWPARMARVASSDEVVLVPPTGTRVQVIDVEDLARWLVVCAEDGTSGTCDATGEVIAFEDLIGQCLAASGREAVLASARQQWLLEQGVNPWAGPESLPLWLPVPEYAGMLTRNVRAAHQSGLSPRPLAETVRAALAWERHQGLGRTRQAGLSQARETELLAALPADRPRGDGPATCLYVDKATTRQGDRATRG